MNKSAQCQKAFKRKDKLQCHINTVHSTEYKKKFDCSKCEKKFSSSDAFKHHVKLKSLDSTTT